MNRRFFLQHGFVGGAAFTTLGGALLSLASCKREEYTPNFNGQIQDALSLRERRRDDLFSFFYSEKSIDPILSLDAKRNIMTAFQSTTFVITTNFNPFDDFFRDLQVKTHTKGLKNSTILLNLPKYNYYDFYIKKVSIRSVIRAPKKGLDFYLVNKQFVNQILEKYNIKNI